MYTYMSLRVKHPLFLSDFNDNSDLDRLSKNTQIQHVMKIRPVTAEVLHAAKQPGRHDEINSRFSQFCKHA
jgi:hypothetical protein